MPSVNFLSLGHAITADEAAKQLTADNSRQWLLLAGETSFGQACISSLLQIFCLFCFKKEQ